MSAHKKQTSNIAAAESPDTRTWRFPAEWEAQDAVVIAWPHAQTDWAPWLAEVEASYIALAKAILMRANLVVLVKNQKLEARARRLIASVAAEFEDRLLTTRVAYNDTWLRDTGPISLRAVVNGEIAALRWLDCSFTGWGGKYQSSLDDKIVSHLVSLPEFSHIEHQRLDFALEGGAIESDGRGTLMSTWNCLSKRHPGKLLAEVDQVLRSAMHMQRSIWLHEGELDGDDTDAHIDTLARFASAESIVFQGCDDHGDPHFEPLQAMHAELKLARSASGQAYTLFELPWAGELYAQTGRRLAASYANFLILNGAVLMPTYGVSNDSVAASVMAQAFPGFEIVAVDCRPFIEQNGSLHCLTMQLPSGCLRKP